MRKYRDKFHLYDCLKGRSSNIAIDREYVFGNIPKQNVIDRINKELIRNEHYKNDLLQYLKELTEFPEIVDKNFF